MKNISPIWFIKDPIDPEHKEYILLDYLKSISKDLDSENCYSTLRAVSQIIKSLNEFKDTKIINPSIIRQLKSEEKEYVKKFKFEDLEEDDRSTLNDMITDKIISYYWQGSVTLKTSEGDKEICVLKKIYLKNQTFSLNYEYIYHEILEEFSIEKRISPELHVIEIYENFDENSEIYKLAKEKFIETIT